MTSRWLADNPLARHTATAVGEFLIFACAFIYLYRRLDGIPIHAVILKPVLAGGCAYVAFLLLHGYSWMLSIPVMGLVYVGVLLLVKTFDSHEIQVFVENTFQTNRRLT
jgi:peptidoglycan/LPS O-acetylase OafA/YrhL